MSDTTMPATEAAVASHDDERGSYELAFHVLPTVAEGEVSQVFSDLKTHIEQAGGTLTSEEAPQRFYLAYEIIKYVEGKNRRFTSAYFGWVRFTLPAEKIAELSEEIDADQRLLRYLIIRLTKVEEEHPFYFHEALKERKVRNVADEDVTVESRSPQAAKSNKEDAEKPEESQESKQREEVDDTELDEALKKEEEA